MLPLLDLTFRGRGFEPHPTVLDFGILRTTDFSLRIGKTLARQLIL